MRNVGSQISGIYTEVEVGQNLAACLLRTSTVEAWRFDVDQSAGRMLSCSITEAARNESNLVQSNRHNSFLMKCREYTV